MTEPSQAYLLFKIDSFDKQADNICSCWLVHNAQAYSSLSETQPSSVVHYISSIILIEIINGIEVQQNYIKWHASKMTLNVTDV